jgi:hypothetical protein
MIVDAQPSSESSSPLRFETLGYIAIDCLPICCSINRAPVQQAAEEILTHLKWGFGWMSDGFRRAQAKSEGARCLF